MAEQCPTKNDIQAIFKRLRAVPTNKVCFDCSAKNPTWASVTYGVFICIDCSAVHRSLGVHLSFVRSTQLDTNWTWVQLRQMQLGGNANATTFFRQHNSSSTDAQQKYNSRAAQLYKDKLRQQAVQAMRIHGTQLHLDAAPQETTTTEVKDVDFFDEHSFLTPQIPTADPLDDSAKLTVSSNTTKSVGNGNVFEEFGAPNVEAALSTSPAEAQKQIGERKSTIAQRKPMAKKTGLGAKKGLGAQKVKADFAEIEREAQLADELRVKMAEELKISNAKKAEDEEKQLASMRLAYQDLSVEQKKQEEKLKNVDPKKAQQVERLGMGFGSRSGVSHSAMGDMQTIEQDTPSTAQSRATFEQRMDDFFDDFTLISTFPSRYKSPSHDSRLGGAFESDSTFSKKKSFWDDDFGPSNTTSSFNSMKKSYSSEPVESRPKRDVVTTAPSTDEAQKKFGNAKAISSDQFFHDKEPDYERRANLARFEGQSSISSAAYFGRSEERPPSFSSSLQAPDLDEVKESVRQGVTKVAGKLSSLANGVLHTLERYGN